MDRQAYHDMYYVDMEPAEYYASVSELSGRDPLATARTLDTDISMPPSARAKLFNISAEVKNYFHEYGTPMPPLMEGCTVVDLGCGSGRDTYLAAQFVGPEGKVYGVEPNEKRLAVGEKYLDMEMSQFGYESLNVEFVHGAPEDLSFLPDASVDIVISNCTFNLSPDKEAYVREVRRVLKEGGEWYFTDVFSSRRIPPEKAQDLKLRAIRLGGAMYLGDFRRLIQAAGFADYRRPFLFKTELSRKEKELFPGIEFVTATVRVLKSSRIEDECELFGESIVYDGSLPDYPDAFPYDYNMEFKTDVPHGACSNVAALCAHSRYKAVFKHSGDEKTHAGSVAVDRIIMAAKPYDGVYDEDDQPINASCC